MTVFLALADWERAFLSGAIAATLILAYLWQKKLVSKSENAFRKGWFILIYLADAVVFFAALAGVMLLWNFDFATLFDDFFTNTATFLLDKIGAIIGSIITVFLSVAIVSFSKHAFGKVGLKAGPLQKRRMTIAKVSLSIVKYTVVIIVVLVILALWGVNVVPALAGLGIVGLVVGLGAQNFINDLISGFFIIFEHHFDVGDIVEIEGFKGEVSEIGLKTTRIRNWKGEVKIIANGNITNLINYSRNPSLAIIDFGIAYGEDIEKTVALMKAELPKLKDEIEEIIEAPQVLGVIDLADSAVVIRVIVKTMTEKHYGVERQTRQRIKELLDQNNIEIPFPQVVVHQAKSGE
ncbi:MAG TPA: mechanosensitive ion channel family protein [Bacillota bacterium]|nr:mechanosensitive ion channel family protein [Bacillota bacterium]HPF42717.1 mechanosensitive ion channel family protein [Bacillota bacterium]HPJ85546.1 mechanosensitive ion channel family protein [Bacillota bacterium]HPQ62064.1 mechanosensitive ion channel family protein [Bacillota bacterium]HRX91739.1 mechanosensitive ion channel family protein [Candidatus Izemoplasmatales bacterium]